MDQKWSTSVNCYIELQGLHRFQDDLEWGLILQRIRRDTYTQHDIDAINECVFVGDGRIANTTQAVQRKLPSGTAYCVYGNADRVAINAGIFANILTAQARASNGTPEHMLLVKASNMKRVTPSGKKIPLQDGDKYHIYESCGDHHLRQKGGKRGGKNFVDLF